MFVDQEFPYCVIEFLTIIGVTNNNKRIKRSKASGNKQPNEKQLKPEDNQRQTQYTITGTFICAFKTHSSVMTPSYMLLYFFFYSSLLSAAQTICNGFFFYYFTFVVVVVAAVIRVEQKQVNIINKICCCFLSLIIDNLSMQCICVCVQNVLRDGFQ